MPVEPRGPRLAHRWWKPLRRGGWHAPIVLVDGRLISQGHALNREPPDPGGDRGPCPPHRSRGQPPLRQGDLTRRLPTRVEGLPRRRRVRLRLPRRGCGAAGTVRNAAPGASAPIRRPEDAGHRAPKSGSMAPRRRRRSSRRRDPAPHATSPNPDRGQCSLSSAADHAAYELQATPDASSERTHRDARPRHRRGADRN